MKAINPDEGSRLDDLGNDLSAESVYKGRHDWEREGDFFETGELNSWVSAIRSQIGGGGKVYALGKQSAIDKFIEQVKNSLGGFYDVSIDADNVLNYVRNSKQGELNTQQTTFLNILDEKAGVDIILNLVESSSDIQIDNYSNHTLDVDDVNAFANSKVVPIAAILAHCFAEQRAYSQSEGEKKYITAHLEDGLVVESRVSGFKRDESKTDNRTKRDPANSNTSYSGFVFWVY
jgi:hypothetical protein